MSQNINDTSITSISDLSSGNLTGSYIGPNINFSMFQGMQLEEIIKLAFRRIEQLEERLLVVEPNIEKMRKYPALRSAYNNYKTIDKLLGDD